MTRATKTDLRSMEKLLERERMALRAADMQALARIARRKTDLLERLEGAGSLGPEQAEALARVRAQSQRNARLFEAALRGLTEAQALIRRLGDQNADKTYRRDGARQQVASPARSFERRA